MIWLTAKIFIDSLSLADLSVYIFFKLKSKVKKNGIKTTSCC